MPTTPRRTLALAFLWLAAAACGHDASTGPTNGSSNPPTTGSLTVTVSAPSGVTPLVTVYGPNAFEQRLSATQTLSGLAPGSYSVTGWLGASSDAMLGNASKATVSGSPATVAAGATATATATYGAASTPGMLWVANQGGVSISGYSAAQLATSGSPAPAIAVGANNKPGSRASGIAIDPQGGMWVNSGRDTLYYFSASQIASSTTAAPTRFIVANAGTNSSITGMAFDDAGNLWICDQGVYVIEKLSAAQLAAGGAVTPDVVLHAVFGSISRPWGLAFDAKGNLWVANYGNNSIAAFAPSDLMTSGNPVPVSGLTGSKGLTGPLGLAFDAQGNLWIASISDTIAKFQASDLTKPGAPTPSVVLSGNFLRSPWGLAFDQSGALWVGSYQGNSLFRFLPSQLATSGSPTPSVTIGGAGLALPTMFELTPHPGSVPMR